MSLQIKCFFHAIMQMLRDGHLHMPLLASTTSGGLRELVIETPVFHDSAFKFW